MKIRYQFFFIFASITLFSLGIHYWIARLGVEKIVYRHTEQILQSELKADYLIIQNFIDQFQLDLQRLVAVGELRRTHLPRLLRELHFDRLEMVAAQPTPAHPQAKVTAAPENTAHIDLEIQAGRPVLVSRIPLSDGRRLLCVRALQPALEQLQTESGQEVLLYWNSAQFYTSNQALARTLRHVRFEIPISQWLARIKSSGLFVLDTPEQQYKANYRTIDLHQGRLNIVLLQSVAFEQQITAQMLTGMIIFSLFFMVVLLIFSFYISKNVISPFQNLILALKKRQKKQVSELVVRRDEIGEIADQFWQMMDDLYAQQAQKEKVHSLIAHDLKTPLIAISRTLENIRDQDQLSREHRINLINMMLKHCNHSLQLITNLLNVQKYELGKIQLYLTENELNALITEAVEGLRPLAQAKQIQIMLTLAPTPLPLMLDRLELLRVLKNILANAIQYSPAHSMIAVSSRAVTQGAEVAVQDQGPGIPAALQTTIFDFYNRNNQVLQDRAEMDLSTGLGLYLCRQILEAHTGWLKLDSQEGQGSLFTFFLPARPVSGRSGVLPVMMRD
jgi:signal transduction histidine kinase